MQEINRRIWVWQDGDWKACAERPPAAPVLHEQLPLTRRANGAWCLFRLHDHIQTLFRSTRRVGFIPPCSPEQLSAQTESVARSFLDSGIALLASGNALATFTLHSFRAEHAHPAESDGAECQLVVEFQAKPATRLHEPVALCFSTEEPGAFSALGNVTRNVAWLAHRMAQRAGFFTALLRDPLGRVSGAAFATVFCASEGRLYTPHLSSGAFPGLTRSSLLTLGEESGFDVSEQELTREQVFGAEEVFLANSFAGLIAVKSIDTISVEAPVPGPITRRLAARYEDVLFGTDCNHPEWLCLV